MFRTISRAALLIALTSTFAIAQTGPELLLKPFPRERTFEGSADVFFLADGETENAGSDFQLTLFETFGRARVFPGQRADPRVGFDLAYIDIDSDDPALPDSLIDHSVAFGMGVFDYSGWLGGLTVGVGYAADSAYADANAWYGRATLAFGREIDESSQIGIVFDYDGNRSIYPDIPLVGFQYRKRIDDKLRLGFGFPVTSLTWTPSERVTVQLDYWIPERLDARVDYTVYKELGIFTSFVQRIEAFHLDELPHNRRLIFEQRRAEAGVRWDFIEEASLVVAGGYAFDQEFNVGWDTRHARNIAEPSDELYLRVGVEVRY